MRKVKNYDSHIAQIILSKIFTILGFVFAALASLFYLLMNFIPAHMLTFFIMAIVFYSVGIPFIVVGVSFGIYVSKKEQEKERLMTEGHRVLGKVIDYKDNYQVSLNRRHPAKLICESDEYEYDEKKRYISDNYWGNPDAAIGSDVTIYVDRENSGRYYIDLRNV